MKKDDLIIGLSRPRSREMRNWPYARTAFLVVIGVVTLLGWTRVNQDRVQAGARASYPSSSYLPLVGREPLWSESLYLPAVFYTCDPYPPLDWDPRLGTGPDVLPHLQSVRLVPAVVASGQRYWRVIRVKFEDVAEAGNDHTIYVKVIDENCQRVYGTKGHLTSIGGLSEYPEEKPAGDLCDCNFSYPMFGDGYNFNIEDEIPSDMVAGMIMPMRHQVNYRITFQRATMP